MGALVKKDLENVVTKKIHTVAAYSSYRNTQWCKVLQEGEINKVLVLTKESPSSWPEPRFFSEKKGTYQAWVWRSILPWWAQGGGASRERGREREEGGEGGEGREVRSMGRTSCLAGSTEPCVLEPPGPG